VSDTSAPTDRIAGSADPLGSPNAAAPRRLLATLAFTAIYAGILLWFYGVDVYHQHFSEAGPLVLVHNVCRVLFIFYLFWIVHEAGAFLLRLVSGDAIESASAVERVVLRFFAGTGVWHVALVGLGYLGLYTRPIAVAITLPVVAVSYRRFAAAVRGLRHLLATRFPQARTPAAWLAVMRTPIGAATGLLAVLFVAVLMIKGLYPSGGHDYFTHYFHYLRAVVERGNIWPNEVWYHYYYLKGSGLFFLAMLLTDPLAPQLVTFTFYAASLLALFLMLRRLAPSSRWVCAGMVLFLGLFIYTPGAGGSRAHGGWGDFEKLHELNAALTLAIIWIATRMLETHGREMLAALAAGASAVATAIILNTTAGAYFVAVFGLLMLWHLWRRKVEKALQCACLAVVAGVVAAATLLVNQLTTGLMSDQILGLAWKFADVEKLHAWGALPPLLTTLWGRAGMALERTTLIDAARLLVKTPRPEMFGPLLVLGAAAAVIASRRARAIVPVSAQVLLASLAATIVFALTTGIAQPISFYRYTSFVLPIVLLCGVLLVRIGYDADGPVGRIVRDPRTPLAVVVACFISAMISYHPRRAPADAVIDATRFAVGWYSIDKAYTTQEGWAARQPYGAIYPGARGAYEAIGPHVRIWSLHNMAYCMLPDCRVETWPAFATTREWDRLMFGSPEEGRAALQAAGLDFFLFSTDLMLNNDPLPRSPLMAPDNIASYLGIRWTDGTTTLLTWLGPGVTPLDPEWVARYRRAVAESGSVQSFPLDQFRTIYANLRATPHPWRSFFLPWSRTP
jgi:hypothetical protein